MQDRRHLVTARVTIYIGFSLKESMQDTHDKVDSNSSGLGQVTRLVSRAIEKYLVLQPANCKQQPAVSGRCLALWKACSPGAARQPAQWTM